MLALRAFALIVAIAHVIGADAASHRHHKAAVSLKAADPFGWDPVANKDAIVLAGNARFTVLTSRVIRLEYSADHLWQDEATIVAVRRNLPVPKFTVKSDDMNTMIQTDYLTLNYRHGDLYTFNSSNINIVTRFNTTNPTTGLTSEQSVEWNAVNHEDTIGNLKGTIRTLDQNRDQNVQFDCVEDTNPGNHCTYGLISRRGYALVDDTHRPSFDKYTKPTSNETWPWFNGRSWTSPPADQCQIQDNSMRRDCANPGVTQDQCASYGCCWNQAAADHVEWGIPACYYSVQAAQDLYFFGHGHDYAAAMKDFTAVSGPIPLPPRYIFGVFFSRYWAYSSLESKQIVREYVEHDIPLDTLVTDMDWHKTFYKQANAGVHDQSGQPIGWSGFTYDEHLFVNPAAFLKWCKELGLRNTLNLHPASGIQPWEDTYEEMAIANGVDPASGKYVPFNATSQLYISTWFNITLRPLEDIGIDLWWLDWQQGEDWVHNPPFINPTMLLNYQFFTDPFHWQHTKTRPSLLHRWPGLGGHRYQIGFSGDVIPNWDTLTLQTYFTPTAANVGYSYWSHDLGGHVAPPDAELYTRWLQWGAFSPVFRTHCTKNVDNDRRIYTYPWAYYTTLRKFIKLRQSLTPYIYSQARITYETSLATVLPLYYRHAEFDEAYEFKHEFYFGEQMVIAPVSAPISSVNNMTEWTFWVPPGEWVNIFTLETYTGPMNVTKNFTLAEMPALARSGSIIPMLPEDAPSLGQAQLVPDRVKWLAVIGSSTAGSGRLYDDAGDDQTYVDDAYTWTLARYSVRGSNNDEIAFTIRAAEGNSFAGFPETRKHQICIKGVLPATSVKINGQAAEMRLFNDLRMSGRALPQSNSYSYDGASLTLNIYIDVPVSTSKDTQVDIQLIDSVTSPVLADANGWEGRVSRFAAAKATLDDQWGTDNTVYQDDYPNLLFAAEAGEFLTYEPQNAVNGIKAFAQYAELACHELTNITNLLPSVQTLLVSQLC